MQRLIFWQNVPSMHQAPLMEALVKLGVEVSLVAQESISPGRLKLGWQVPDFPGVDLVLAGNSTRRDELLSRSQSDTAHIFSGIGAYREPTFAARSLSRARWKGQKAMLGIYAEPLRWDGVKGRLREAKFRLAAAPVRSSVDFVLATGRLAIEQYSAFGFHNVHSYAYFTAHAHSLPCALFTRDPSMSRFRFGFVGQLIHRKRVDLLLRAFSRASIPESTLDIVGTGDLQSELMDLATVLDISDSVAWHGSVPNEHVSFFMESIDCLVLPSDFDGWGAVANEALTVGTPVIISSSVGSSVLLTRPEVGSVFQAGSVDDLSSALWHRSSRPSSYAERGFVKNWAKNSIHPAVGARYLLDIISAVENPDISPTAPWDLSDSE